MARDFTYRLYRPGDEAGICRLFQEVFHKSMSVERWRWKYRSLPFGEALNMVCVNDEGDIVGHFGAQPLPFQRRGVSYKTGQLMDGMLKKEYRAKGIYLELCRVFFRICDDAGFRLLFGFPTERMCHVVCLGGFFLVDEIHRFTKTLGPEAASTGLFPKGAGGAPHVRNLGEMARNGLELGFFKARAMSAGDPRVAMVWKSFRATCPCSLDRTREYLRWRFDLHPDHEYLRVGVFTRGGQVPVSFWIARIVGDMAYLLEGFSRSPRGLMWSVGLDKLETYLARLGVRRAAAILPRWHPCSRILLKKGYDPVPEGRITARLGYDTPREVTEGWYYTYGDHDDF